MRTRCLTVYAIGLVAFTTPATACEWDPFLFQLPGETEAQANERSEKIHTDFAVVGHFNRETYALEKASRIYLARVVSHSRGSYSAGKEDVLPSSRVHPLHALKGKMPVTDATLTGEAAGGLCIDRGDGEAAFEDVGGLVVVFEGLPRTESRPRGVDSFPAMSIRTIQLLDALRAFGKDLE